MVDVNEHLNLAGFEASKIYKKFDLVARYEYEDILQMCYLGLIHAAKKFDETKGYKFSTFACKWMWGCVMTNILRDKYYPAKEKYKHLNSQVFSLEVKVKNCDEKETTYKDILEDSQDIDTTFNGILVRTAIEKLPDKHREIIKLRYFHEKLKSRLQKCSAQVKQISTGGRKKLLRN
jgi:RNA polymerase sporulation-specific sigma factor